MRSIRVNETFLFLFCFVLFVCCCFLVVCFCFVLFLEGGGWVFWRGCCLFVCLLLLFVYKRPVYLHLVANSRKMLYCLVAIVNGFDGI